MGEYMLKNALAAGEVHDVEVISRAMTSGEAGNGIDERAQRVLAAHGLDASAHRARQLDPEELAGMNLVLAMDTDHFEALVPLLAELDESARPQLRMLRSFDPATASKPHAAQGIYDPWYGDAGDFRQTWQLIHASLPPLVDYVRSHSTTRGNH